MDLGKSAQTDRFPIQGATSEEQRAWLAMDKSRFDPPTAAKEYQDMLENGGTSWEQVLQELDESDRQASRAQPRPS